MLYLIGLGVSDEKDISLKAVDTMEKCTKVYCEMFTSIWHGDLHKLEKMVGRKITLISREDVESTLLVRESKTGTIGLLCPGDPLTATTHIELMIEAKKQNVPVEIVHSSSIYTAVAETGLQIYKFSRSTTLPKMTEKFKPESPIAIIKDNKKQGLHTLLLLDIGMTAMEGLKTLQLFKMDKEMVIACCHLGSTSRLIRYGTVAQLAEDTELNMAPAVIIIPGKLHFKEEEALTLFAK
jgi:diphthine synthase